MNHQSLPMSEHSPILPKSMKELQTWLAQAFPASRSVSQESKKAQTITEICGLQPSQSFARLSQEYASLKTCQDCLPFVTNQATIFGTYSEFSQTWPKQGTMQGGVCWELMIVERGTEESGYGFMPTPTTQEIEHKDIELTGSGRRKAKGGGGSHSLNLADYVKVSSPNTAANLSNAAVGDWPTPTAADHRDRGGPSDSAIARRKEKGKSIELSMTVDGALNPDWVEWLMGWPVGWTSLDDLESDEILNWKSEHGIPRVTKETKNRKQRLQALGNGQVAACVVKAWNLLHNTKNNKEAGKC